ncbi:bacterio-opsin activator domain-containing protein [Haloarchaeobius amylolyticus]|uniref:bacterio-opsin activator domain-containing protein n=1 Tax=Haloarchaeobius amylolyticus TaxID=1198296 RepID=UPI002270296A|nr:bacterio-opsin activator domain-containing protein [Haloarchaeobius amylolyticus]
MEEEINSDRRGEESLGLPDRYGSATAWQALTEAGFGLVEVDETGTIVGATPSVADTLGYTSEPLVGQSSTRLFPESEVQSVLDLLAELADDDDVRVVRHRGKDGNEVALPVSVHRVETEEQVTYVEVVRDFEGVSADEGDTDAGSDRVLAPAETPDRQTGETRSTDVRSPGERPDHVPEPDQTGPSDAADDTTAGRATDTLYRELFDQSHDAIVIFDTETGRLVDANDRAVGLLGAEQDEKAELVGTHASRLFRDDTDGDGDGSAGRGTAARLLAGEVTANEDLPCRRTDGSPITVVVKSVVRSGDVRLAVAVQDVTDRRRRETEQTDRVAAMDAALEGIATLDEEYRVTYANEEFASLHDTTVDETVGSEWQEFYTDEEWRKLSWQVLPAVEREGTWRGEATGRRADGETFPQSLSLSTVGGGGLVAVVHDLSAQKHYSRRLRDLNVITHRLMSARSDTEIATIGCEAVGQVVGLPLNAIRLHDPESNDLVLTEAPESTMEVLGPRPRYDVETTPAGRAFETGETVITVVNEADPYGRYPLSEAMYVPLGEHGVMSVGTTDPHGFSREEVDLAELLGANLTVAFTRARRDRQLREMQADLTRKQDVLRRQHDRQEILLGISSLVQEITDATVHSKSREEIEQAVCETIASSELYHFAWIGNYSLGRGRIVPRAAAGLDEGVLDEIAQITPTELERGAIDESIETGEAQVVRKQDGDVELHEPVRRAASERGFEAAIAVPLTYAGRNYGGLVVIASHADAFGEFETRAFSVLGELVAFAIRATTDRALLLSDSIIEVEVVSTDRNAALVDLSAEVGCRLTLAGIVDNNQNGRRYYYLVEDAPAATVVAALWRYRGVEDVEVISERVNESLIAIELSGGSLVQSLVEYGVRVREQTVDDGRATVVVEAPTQDDVRDVVELLVEEFPETDVVSVLERDRPVRTANECRDILLGDLTDRQHATLQTAYVEGYFDWPRRSTAEEVADRLDIASSTFHQHVRIALQKVLSALFDEE